MKKPTKRLRLITSLFLLTLTPRIPAEILTDGTVGPPSTLSGPNYMIGHDLGTQSGSNLYHSFDKFNVNTGESATFTGPLDINNVFGRVTGGESFIDGQISSDMPNADIYLINPRGIMFGQNASLNVPGSFYASSADQIILKDGTTFSATNPQNDPPILSAEPFSAFGFLDDDTAPISITGGQFQAGKTFALVGGEIAIENANISSPLIEIESRNVAPITVTNSTITAQGEGRIFFRGGELVVMNSEIQVDSESAGSRIEVDATEMQLTDSSIRLNPIGGSDAGSILIGMGHLDSLSLTNSYILASTFGPGKGGDILIKAANSITFSDNSVLDVSTLGKKENSGDAGSLAIETGSLSLTNSSFIQAVTTGTGKGGEIQIKAANGITLEDESSLNVSTFGEEIGSGDGGSLAIETGSLSLTNSFINASTVGIGNAGDIQIKAANGITLEDDSFLDVSTFGEEIGSGDGGSLAIETGSLSLTNSFINASTVGIGNAGDIQIKAANGITLEDDSFLDVSTFGEEIGSGDGGSLAIETGSLSLTNSSWIRAGTEGSGKGGDIQIKAANSITLEEKSILLVDTSGSGDGGSLAIETGSLSLTNSSIYASTVGLGNAGSIQIKAANSITLEEESGLVGGTSGSGDGGSLAIETGSLSLTNSSWIRAGTEGSGKGGDIQIKAANSITLEEKSGLVVDTAGSGDGGSLAIETGSLSLKNSSIYASTVGLGNAGSIQIKAANSITLEENSGLFADTEGSGDAGSLAIETGSLSFTNSSGIDASTFGAGNAGDVQIKVANSITIEEKSGLVVNTSGSGDGGSLAIETGSLSLTNSSGIEAVTEGTGNAGDIQIKAANSITLEDMSLLRVANISTDSSGDAGSLAIETGSLSLTNSPGIGAVTVGSGNAGDIQIKAANSITLEDSGLFVGTVGSGDAGSIDIETGSLSLTNSEIGASTSGSGNAGDIQIKTANGITLEDESFLSVETRTDSSGDAGSIDIETGSLSLLTNSDIQANTFGPGNAGDIQIKAANGITLEESGLLVDTVGSGDGGSLAIETGSLSLTNSSVIGADTYGSGNAGDIQIKAANGITLEGKSFLSVGTRTDSSGDGGSLAIETGSLSLTKGSIISGYTSGSGKGGDIQIKTANGITLEYSGLFVATSGSGDAGSLAIETGSLSLTKGSIISGYTSGIGNAGDIQIKAANGITLEDESFLSVETRTDSSGDAGSIDIETGSLSLTKGSIISGYTSGSGNAGDIQIKAANGITLEDESFLSVETRTDSSGDAGSIDIETGSLSLTKGSIISGYTSGSGNAGDIQIKAANGITLEGKSFLSVGTRTDSSGDGGSLAIETGSLSLTKGSIISGYTSGIGNAGDIQIKAANSITLEESGLFVNTESSGDAGSIDIETGSLSLTNSWIGASTTGSGSAGKITITASEYLKIFGEGSGIFSLSGDENFPNATGNAGTITIGKDPSVPAPTLTLTEGGEISTASWGVGVSGEIDINVKNLEINQGGKINSSSKGSGSAGKIAITATEYVQIFGEDSGIFSTASNTGDAGQINILAGGTPEDGLEIIPGSLFSAEAELIPHDQGGLVLENGGEISTSTSGQGDGGTITITSSKLRLNNAEITADNEVADFNQAGNIIIGAHQLDMSDSTISTSSTNADGGNILIGVRELNNKRITDSQIAATAGETGIGGNLEIRGPKYLILDSTDLKADADKGGNLTLDADVFIASSDSQIEASGVLQTPEHIDVGAISLLPNQGVDVSKMVKECTASDSKEEWSLKQVGYGERKKGCVK
jgi:filamentous hemagglutinin family protein